MQAGAGRSPCALRRPRPSGWRAASTPIAHEPPGMNLFRKKLPATEGAPPLRRCLSAWDLTFMGIGQMIGAGIFVLTGVAAATQAGPAIVLSFVVAGIACAFVAFSYAELASCVGGCGGAYSFAYALFWAAVCLARGGEMGGRPRLGAGAGRKRPAGSFSHSA